MGRGRTEIDHDAPIRWVEREDFQAYFDSLPADERWSHPSYHSQAMIWHWEERRWWALEQDS